METIIWADFWYLLPFMVAGLVVHILNKIDTARRRPGYVFRTFIYLNGIGYLVSLILCAVGLAFLASGIDLIPGVGKMVVSFTLGFGGGSLIRSWTAKFGKSGNK
jgi:hypothetical protein